MTTTSTLYQSPPAVGKAHFSPRRLGHVNLWVSDLERSIRFYQKVCGIELVRRERAIKIAFHSNGNTHHDIGIIEISRGVDRVGRDGTVQIPATRGVAVGLNHLGWEMESEAALVDAYKRSGGRDGDVPLRAVDHLISHSVYLSDPDGNSHEFYADALQDWRSIYNLNREDEVTGTWDPDDGAPDPTPHYNVDPPLRKVVDAPLHPGKLVAATIATRNFFPMRDFFEEVAGLRQIGMSADPRAACFTGDLGRTDLMLMEAAAGASTGLQSFTFDLLAQPDERALARMCGQWGLPPAQATTWNGMRALRLADPDGFAIHFLQA